MEKIDLNFFLKRAAARPKPKGKASHKRKRASQPILTPRSPSTRSPPTKKQRRPRPPSPKAIAPKVADAPIRNANHRPPTPKANRAPPPPQRVPKPQKQPRPLSPKANPIPRKRQRREPLTPQAQPRPTPTPTTKTKTPSKTYDPLNDFPAVLAIRRALESYVHQMGFTFHHETAFEHFLHYMLPKIIAEQSPINVVWKKRELLHQIHFGHVCIKRPTVKEADGFIREILPNEAHMRKQTYNLDVLVDITHVIYKSTRSGEAHSSSSFFSTAPNVKTTKGKGVPRSTKSQGLQKIKLLRVEEKLHRSVLFCQLPCMLGSTACRLYRNLKFPTRPLGTFQINGHPKVVIPRDTMRQNTPCVLKTTKSLRCEVRSIHAKKIRSTSTLNIYFIMGQGAAPEIKVQVPFIDPCIPLTVIFRLLGVKTITEMSRLIAPDNTELRDRVQRMLSLDQSNTDLMSEDELYDWINLSGTGVKQKSRKIPSMRNIFANEFLPHCVVDGVEKKQSKAFYLAYCVRKLVLVGFKQQAPDDQDDFRMKRCERVGIALGRLLRQLVRSSIRTLRAQIFKAVESQKYLNVVGELLNPNSITSKVKRAFATGNWMVQKTAAQTNQSGNCQVLNTMNITSINSQLRAMDTPINRDCKQPQPRQLHKTAWGVNCAAETPEGRSVGLLNNQVSVSQVRCGTPSQCLIDTIWFLLPVSREIQQSDTLVLVNGVICGSVADPADLVARYKTLRAHGDVPMDSSITRMDRVVEILCEDGNVFRPILNLERVRSGVFERVYRRHSEDPASLWTELHCSGVVEYVNKEEEANLWIAMQPEDLLGHAEGEGPSHVELSISMTAFGLAAAAIPALDHNQAPRNMYQTSMAKQAIAARPLDFYHKMNTRTYVLAYPQVPLVSTESAADNGLHDEPTGQNLRIGVFSGIFNQEDSVILSQKALHLNALGTFLIRAHRDVESRHGSDIEAFTNDLNQVYGKRKADYTKLDKTGTARLGATIEKETVTIGKKIDFALTTSRDGKVETTRAQRDRSLVSKNEDPTKVQAVMFSKTKDGLRSTAVRTMAYHIPETGDKLASRHGQKGIVGMVVRQEDMMTTLDGIPLDIIINPHAIPSRMTVGQLIEQLLSRLACVEGKIVNSTPFSRMVFKYKGEGLDRKLFPTMNGVPLTDSTPVIDLPVTRQVLLDGKTGEMTEPVYVGFVYYQVLKHMVGHKVYARSEGGKQVLTRQPHEGRLKGGGARQGEMERDCQIAHGAMGVLKENLLNKSDRYVVWICKTCQRLAESPAPTGSQTILHQKPYCRTCRRSDDVRRVVLPYPCKLLAQELEATHIKMGFELEDEVDDETGDWGFKPDLKNPGKAS